MAIQDKFNKPNVIYKITKDIDLEGGTLTIPVGCTLDFQGGSFRNGYIKSNNTIIKGNPRESSLFGAFWTTNGELYGSLIDYKKDSPDSVLSYYPVYSDSSYRYAGVTPINTSGICMNDDYIFTFTISDKSSTGPDYKSIFCVNDHKGNLISSGVINMGGHVNDAAILGNSIIVPCSENGSITRFLIADLLGGNNKIVDGSTFMKEYCYSLDIDGNFIYLVGEGYIKQYDITGTTLIQTFNINIEGGGSFATNSVYKLVNQAIVVKDGILYVNESIIGQSTFGYATAVYDLATLTPITIQPVKINTFMRGESEGLCKYDGNIYMSVVTKANNRFLNLLYKLPSTKNNSISAGYPLSNPSLLMTGDLNVITYYVNTDYRGFSNGSLANPFKSLDEAFVMITPTMVGCTISITSTGKTYDGFTLVNIGIPIIIDGGGNEFISPVTIQYSNKVYLRNATLKNTTLEIYNSNVELSNIQITKTLLENGSYGINSISNNTLQLRGVTFTNIDTCIKGGYAFIKTLSGITINNVNTICNISDGTVFCSNKFTKAQLLSLKSYPFIGGITTILVGNSMKFSSSDIDEITAYYNTLSTTMVDSRSIIKMDKGYVIEGKWIPKSVGNYEGAFTNSEGFPLILPKIASELPILNNIAGRKGGYTFYNTSTKKFLIYSGNEFYDVFGNKDVPSSGPTSNRPSQDDIIIGFQYFDTTLNKPIWWTGDKWVDATGTDV